MHHSVKITHNVAVDLWIFIWLCSLAGTMGGNEICPVVFPSLDPSRNGSRRHAETGGYLFPTFLFCIVASDSLKLVVKRRSRTFGATCHLDYHNKVRTRPWNLFLAMENRGKQKYSLCKNYSASKIHYIRTPL